MMPVKHTPSDRPHKNLPKHIIFYRNNDSITYKNLPQIHSTSLTHPLLPHPRLAAFNWLLPRTPLGLWKVSMSGSAEVSLRGTRVAAVVAELQQDTEVCTVAQ